MARLSFTSPRIIVVAIVGLSGYFASLAAAEDNPILR